MTQILDIPRWLPPMRDAAAVMLDASVKSVAVLAVAGVAMACMRRRSAAARHLVCFLAVASLPLLPVLAWTLPGWRVLPQWMDFHKAGPVAVEAQQKTLSPSETSPEIPFTPQPVVSPLAVKTTAASKPLAEPARMNWWRAGLLVWLAGLLMALVPAVLGLFSLHRLARTSRRETAASWLNLLGRLLTRLGFNRRVELLKAARRRMPMTWGVLRPKVLLPEESQEWPEERRSVVLLHELAHAQRCDYLTHLITRLVCALYWFNPLVWLAARRMVAERERACDDIVLRHGAEPADYAEQVLEISAGLAPGWMAGYSGVAMARPSNLESRLRAILDSRRNRATVTRAMAIAAFLLLTAVLVPVAMMKAAPGPQAEIPKSDWGDPVNGLRTRLVAAQHTFRAGEPIRVRIEIENVSNQPKTFQSPAAPNNDGLVVRDSNDQPMAFIHGPAQVGVRDVELAPGKTLELEPFDLAEYYYLSRPGRYTVQLPAERFLMRLPDEPPRLGLPLSGKMAFAIVAEAKADPEDDAIWRLLPVLQKHWMLDNSGNRRGRLRVGGRVEEVFGRSLTLIYNPTGYKVDAGEVDIWLSRQPVGEVKSVAGEKVPTVQYMGKAGALHIYIGADAKALKGWPTVKEDILRALQGGTVGLPAASVAGRIERLIEGASSTTNRPAEILETAPGLVKDDYYNTDDSKMLSCVIFHLPARNRFYIRWENLKSQGTRYYGPFEGDPFQVLSPAMPAADSTPPVTDSNRVEPDNPLGLDDETIIRFFNTGKALQWIVVIAGGPPLAPENQLQPASVGEMFTNYINRDEIGNDPFGKGKLRLKFLKTNGLTMVRLFSVGPDGVWDGGKPILGPDLRGDLGAECEAGKFDVHWLAGGAVLDYLTGAHTARYLAKKGPRSAAPSALSPPADEVLQFGPVVDGLRAAVELIPSKGLFILGDPIKVRFHIQNATNYDIQIAGNEWRQGDKMLLETENGGPVLDKYSRPVMVNQAWYSGWSGIQRQTLKPGETAVFNSNSVELLAENSGNQIQPPVGYSEAVPPGRYKIHFQLEFPGWNARLMDWQGTLATGPETIDVKEAFSHLP